MTFLDNIEQIITLYPLAAFGAVFLAGVISSASPCVPATIPLVVGFVGGYADGDRLKAFRYSLAFVFGLSLTFTAFGAAAGLPGTMFGTLGGPWYLIAGIVGSFLLGLLFGVVSSPCATPVPVVLLTLVAGKGQVFYGVALLFCYAIGHCLLMLFAGTFTGFVEGFVKTKGVVDFSRWAKRVSGGIITAAAGWFILQAF